MGSAKRHSTSGKKKYSGLALNELRELRQLREENGKLKRLVADLSLDRHMLQEIVRKKRLAPRRSTQAISVEQE
jgi:putative transposase